jgi:hypothetical protein
VFSDIANFFEDDDNKTAVLKAVIPGREGSDDLLVAAVHARNWLNAVIGRQQQRADKLIAEQEAQSGVSETKAA